MAINIKELFNADADNIKVDKINYNFDQLILSGGGPSGIKGDTGLTGNTGLKGEKGDIGSKGEEGTKGEQGSSANLWDRDTILSASGDVDVYRPYDNVSGLRSRIVLGESTVLNSQIPPSDTDSLLNLTLPPATNNDVSSQIIFSNDEPGDPKDFKMSTFYQAGVGTKFTFGATSATGNENTNLLIDIPDDIEITAGNKVGISSTNSSVNIAAPTLIELDADDDINMYAGSQIEVESPEITIQGPGGSGGTIDISSFTNTINAPQSGGTNTISANSKNTITSTNLNEILSDGGKNLIRANNATNEILAEVNTIEADGTNNRNILRNSGVNKFMTEDSINTSTQSILFSDPDGDHDGDTDETVNLSEVSFGDGIQFKLGLGATGGPSNGGSAAGFYAAPNSGTANNPEFRTLSDYFYEDSLVNCVIAARRQFSGGGTMLSEPTDNSPSPFSTLAVGNSSGFSSTVSYVKVGNSITVNGHFGCRTHSGWNGFGVDSSLDNNHFVLRFDDSLDNGFKFPYLNNGTAPTYVNVAITTQFDSDFDYGGYGGDATRNSYFGFLGIIYPNSNTIYFYKNGVRLVGSSEYPVSLIPLSPKDLSRAGDTQNLNIGFSFTMTTKWNSYNRVKEDGIVFNPGAL